MGKWLVPYHGASEEFLRAHVAYEGDDCLLWPYGKTRLGYGYATVNGAQTGAHRWMCILAHGEPGPLKIHAAHSCHNPSCVNPRHLRWATHAENMADKEEVGTVARGENSGRTKLTEADVLAIRAAPANLRPLMERYGLGKHALSKIRSGKRWAHVGGRRTSHERGTSPTCWNGHPFDAKNTRWTSDGYRQCRACDAENARRRRRSADAISRGDHNQPGNQQ